jgi:hypothetical protein
MKIVRSVKPMKKFPQVQKIMWVAVQGKKFSAISAFQNVARTSLHYMIMVDRGL